MTVTRPARTMTAPPLGNTSTSVKAKHADNQGALDRLQEMLERAAQSNFKFTLKRAINAVRDCKHPIVTIEQAMELKYVGDRLSRIIVPNATRSAPLPAAAKKKPPPPPPASVATLNTTAEPSRKRKSKQTTLTSSGSIVVPSSEPPAASEETSVKPSAKEKAFETARKQAEELVLPSGPWKVILLVDIREHRSKNVVAKCQQSGIPCEERSLPIGDMAWIAQCQTPTTVVEVLLGTILERKEVNDLASSIHGTRFLEQRLRLYHCGLPQILYLVEGDLNSVQNCPAETLRMAMMETRVQLGFSVLQTKHLQDTVQTLKGLHRRLVQRTFPDAFDELPIFAGRGSGPQDRRKKRRRPSSLLELVFDTPPVPPFGRSRFTTYAELKAKVERDREAGTKRVGAIYMAMLKQVTSLSQKKCQAIAAEYPTWSHLLTAYDGVCESSHQASSSSAALVGGDDSVKQPPTALLVKDVLSGQQKVGPKSAAELDIVCCVERIGTLMKLREGGAIGPPPTKKAATALESTRTTAAAVATTAARTVSDSSNSSTGTAYRGTSAGSSSTGAPTHSSTSTWNAAAAAHSQGADASSCLDLTMDSPAPKEQAATGRTTTFASAYEPIWSEEHDSSSEDEALASRAPTFSSSGNGGDDGKNNKLTNVSRRDKGQVTLAIDIDSDDDDDDSKEDITLDMATNLATSNVARMPLFATMLSSTATTNGTLAESGPPRNVASRKPRRDWESDTTFCFSSPSTTNSGLALSQDSNSSEKKDAKAARTLKNTTNQRQQQADQSIVVIDSSDDEENCGIAVAKAPSSAATALLQSSQNSSASGEPPDLRSRLAKHLGRETIEIDI